MGESVSVVRETERKYEAGGAAQLLDPPGLLGLEAAGGVERQRLEALYFDTPDLRLLRAGVTLRRRVGGPDEGWHLKLPAGGDSRDEHRLPLSSGNRVDLPAELASLVTVHSRGAALAPVAKLDTKRRRWMMSDSDGRELVELVEDEVRAHTMGAETRTASWHEIEVELADHGQMQLLDGIEKQLAKVGVRRSTSKSKLGRLLADRVSAGPKSKAGGKARKKARKKQHLKPGSAGAVVLEYVRAQAEQIRAQDPLVRRDAPDAVHQLRVGARRMRSALQAYGKIIDRRATRVLTDELKWVGGELSEARDAEVIEERLVEVINGLPEELVMGPVAAHITRTLARRRSDGQAAAIAALDSDRYLALHDAIDALLDEPPLTKRAKRSAHRELPRQMGRAWRRLDKRKTAAEALDAGPEHDVALHEVRKAGKRLRYAAEIAEPALGKPANRLKKRAKKIHKQLGDHQDAVVAKAAIRELAIQAHLDGGNGFTFGVLHGLESERAADAERMLPPSWEKLNKRAIAKWLEV
jgi:CHAD domain-containing protein